MSLWRRRHGADDNYGITIGQRFSPVGRVKTVWEVINVARYPGDVATHVRLSRVGAQHEGKTLALNVLLDRRFYQPSP